MSIDLAGVLAVFALLVLAFARGYLSEDIDVEKTIDD